MGRGKSEKTKAARREARLAATRQAVRFEVNRGNIEAAVRIALGYAEQAARELPAVEAVYMLQFKPTSLTFAELDRVRAGWDAAVAEIIEQLNTVRELFPQTQS